MYLHARVNIIFLLSCILLLSACEKPEPYTVLAGYIQDGITRAEINRTDSAQIVWSPGDSICVWDRGKQTFVTYRLTSGGQTTGIFKGGDLVSPYVALYPYQPDAYYQKGVHYTLPHTQRAVPYGFDKNALIMLGSIQGANITFSAQVGWIRLRTPQDTHGLRAIRLISNDPMLPLSSDSTWVEIVSEKDLMPAAYYYLTATPRTYQSGLSLRLTYADGTTRESSRHDPITLNTARVETIQFAK